MKNLLYFIIFFVIVGCAGSKTVYWCGDHPCINKKEKEAYFKKTMTVEMKELKKNKIKNNSEIERITQQAKLEEKRRIKDEKSLSKQIEKDEKIIIKKTKKKSKQNVSITNDIENVEIGLNKFDELVEKITRKNTFRSYPDINDIPN